MKARKTSKARRTKAPPAKPMAWAQGYCNAPTAIFAEPRDIPCATLRPGVTFGEAKPEDYTVTHRKHTPAELAEREADRAEVEAKARAVMAEHRALFEADDRLGKLLLALRREAEGGNEAAGNALAFMARESMRMLEELGRAGDVHGIAKNSTTWLRGWTADPKNGKAVRDIAQWELSWPISMPRPTGTKKLSGEAAQAVAHVAGLNLGSGLHPAVRNARPHGKPKSNAKWKAPFTRDCRDALNHITQLREIPGTRFYGCPPLAGDNAALEFYAKAVTAKLRRHPSYRSEDSKRVRDNVTSFILNLFEKAPE